VLLRIYFFIEYLIEIIVRLIWVVGFIHSFIESLILNLMSVTTVWLIIPILIPEKYYDDEIKNTVNYTLVIIAVIAISYLLERQQKEAFYYRLQADAKVRRLTNSFENLKSGFVSLKNGKISFINKHLKDILINQKFNENVEKRKNSTVINTFTEGKIYIRKLLFLFLNLFFLVNRLLISENERGPHEVTIDVKSSSTDSIENFNIPLYYLITHLNFDSLGNYFK
jgi:hypothetical protein